MATADSGVTEGAAGATPDAAPDDRVGGEAASGGEPVAEAAQAGIESLQRELATARAEAGEAREQALRACAEVDNVRKRAERELENAHKYALDRFVAELLPVKDSMELGLAVEGAGVEQLREGTEITLRMLASAVEKFGVQEIDPAGERFDPERHQAMSTRAVEGVAAGTVVQVVQKGYLLNERLVRPALVIVAE